MRSTRVISLKHKPCNADFSLLITFMASHYIWLIQPSPGLPSLPSHLIPPVLLSSFFQHACTNMHTHTHTNTHINIHTHDIVCLLIPQNHVHPIYKTSYFWKQSTKILFLFYYFFAVKNIILILCTFCKIQKGM